MTPTDLRMPNASQRASDLIERWVAAIRGIPLKMALAKLGFAVVAEMEAAYSEGWNAALEAQKREQEKGY